jgi:hypothetical protein
MCAQKEDFYAVYDLTDLNTLIKGVGLIRFTRSERDGFHLCIIDKISDIG